MYLILEAARVEKRQWCKVLQGGVSRSTDACLDAVGVGLYIDNNRGIYFDTQLSLLVCFGF